MCRTDFWTLWEKARVGCLERTASKQVYYQRWNRSPAQVGCMRQMLGPGALGRRRGIRWRGRRERGSGWGIHVNPWLIYVNVWQKPLQYCKVISHQLVKIKGKNKKIKKMVVLLRTDRKNPERKPSMFFKESRGGRAIYLVSWAVFAVAKSLQSCPTLWDPVDCSLPGSSVHGILQAKILECFAMPSSRRSSQPRDQNHVSYVSCIGRQVLYH